MGLTGLLTIAVILLMVADMTPKSSWGKFSVLGADSIQVFHYFRHIHVHANDAHGVEHSVDSRNNAATFTLCIRRTRARLDVVADEALNTKP